MAVLLAAVAVLQFRTLGRQQDLEQQIRNLASQQIQLDHHLRNELSSLQGSLREMAEAERWVAVHRQTVEPGDNCETAQARVEWDLRQWVAGTHTSLLYRTDAGQEWQAAEVRNLGGQNYAAEFPVPGRPMLQVGTAVEYAGGQDSRSVNAMAKAEKAAFDRNYQYLIVAEGPDFNRSTGVKSLPLYGEFVIPVKIQVRVERDGRYAVRLFSAKDGQNRCTRMERAEVRAYQGDRLVTSAPLVEGQPEALTAEWRSEEKLTKLEIILRHSGGEEVVPILL